MNKEVTVDLHIARVNSTILRVFFLIPRVFSSILNTTIMSSKKARSNSSDNKWNMIEATIHNRTINLVSPGIAFAIPPMKQKDTKNEMTLRTMQIT